MTILPKKKQTKEKTPAKSESEAVETAAHSSLGHGHFGHGHSASERGGRRASPPHWSGTGGRELPNERTSRKPSPPRRAGPSLRDPVVELSGRRASPTCWPAAAGLEERLSSHDPGGGPLEEYCHESASVPSHKRRHRSSPHRSSRKFRHGHAHSSAVPERPRTSGSMTPTGGASPVPSCSADVEEAANVTEHNSEDEYVPTPRPENIEDLERWFEKTLKEKKGYDIKRMGEDGACLFRAVADQVFGDQEMHSHVRQSCCDYMAKNSDFYRQYITEDFNAYLNRKRIDTAHGNHIEMQAMCELYNRGIEVYQYSVEPINTFHSTYKTDNEPIRLSYHKNVHYNSVVDPHKATIGVGLGLPGHQPGMADKNLMADALQTSERFQLEQTMFEDKLRETDWEVTQESIQEQVARESYLQWLRDNEKRSTRSTLYPPPVSATCSSAAASESHSSRSPRNRSNNSSPQNSPGRPQNMDTDVPLACDNPGCLSPRRQQPSCSSHIPDAAVPMSPAEGAMGGGASNAAFSPSLYGLSDWDEDDIIAQVMAQSQREYLDSLKKNASQPSTSKQ